ncbi:MAG: adenylosuccinate lyase [Planctomycetes bacterium]|nr:adenylosuccinate lyase [Planctomycetota bacterium]
MAKKASPYERYRSPLIERYASEEMMRNFSDARKVGLWRRLWIALAEAERELGLDITAGQIREMKRFQDNINFDVALEQERKVRHDVMAHVHAFGEQCPKARSIIHLGATSCYVGDNAELIQIRDAMEIVQKKLVNVIDVLAKFALRHKDLPTLGFTHFQPAQPTTVGKRACLWIQDLVLDLDEIEHRIAALRFRGAKGTTGTQASFLALFNGSHSKVKRLDKLVAEKMGFKKTYAVTGQTYPRKVDAQVLAVLSGIAQSAQKFAGDMRLLQNMKEIEEPFGSSQIGSSAMAYKRNPMRCERMASLSRFVICTSLNPAITAAEQWFERTLDDSANKRLSLPEGFLAVDAILDIFLNVASGLVVHPKMIRRHLMGELPFMATEEILMAAVKAGGDRQFLHERIRLHSVDAAKRVKDQGQSNDLLERIANDPAFAKIVNAIPKLTDPARFVGRAPQQAAEFVKSVVGPIRKRYASVLGARAELKV